jgi:hypothetical protein
MYNLHDDPALVATVSTCLARWTTKEEASRTAMARAVLEAIAVSLGGGANLTGDVFIANVHQLSGHLDSHLDDLGHLNIASVEWIRDFIAGMADNGETTRPASTFFNVDDETSRPASTFFNVDVECTATTPTKGCLLTVGIVPVTHNGERWALHRDRLYVRLDQGDMFPEPEHYTSMPWWREQSDTAQDEAYRDRTLLRHAPDIAAKMIAEFISQVQPEWSQRIFTANPVSFDKPWLDDLFANNGIPSPFHYRSLCLRSMRFGMDPSKGFGADRETHDPVIAHHALFDAEAQALDLLDMLNGGDDARP